MLGLTRTANEVLLIWLAVALTIGITLAVLMGRRGHSAFEWFLIGAILWTDRVAWEHGGAARECTHPCARRSMTL